MAAIFAQFAAQPIDCLLYAVWVNLYCARRGEELRQGIGVMNEHPISLNYCFRV